MEEITELVHQIASVLNLDSNHLMQLQVDIMTRKLDRIDTSLTKLVSMAAERTDQLDILQEDIVATTCSIQELENVSEC